MKEFLQMGGYALYVWPSYAIVFTLLTVQAVAPLRRHRQLLAEIARRQT